MPNPLVPNPDRIRLAMLGMVDGNGHPYSWSAIVNGRYDSDTIRSTPYPGIADYLDPQPASALGLPGVEVTHVWCDDPADAEKVSRASFVPNVLSQAQDAIGQVDAVVIATDIGDEHLERARPFIEAGLPVFIDKPLTDNADHLQQFVAWQQAGKPILSTSCMRYALEFAVLRERMPEVGEPRLITGTMMKTWHRYGIHIIEAVYPFLEPGGWQAATNNGQQDGRHLVHLEHSSGTEVMLAVIEDMYGGYGQVAVYGTKGSIQTTFKDSFTAFKTQLEAFVAYLRTGVSPVDFDQTVEQMKLVIAAIRSREQQGRRIELSAI